MQIIKFKVPENFNIFNFACVHTGALTSHEDGFVAMINMMESEYDGIPAKHNFGLDHGDMIESIAVDDWRFSSDTTKIPDIDEQIKHAIRLRLPIKKRLITGLKGNHEHGVIRKTNPAKRICEGLKIPYGTYSAVINYVDKKGRYMFNHYACHGTGSIRTNADNPIRRRSNLQIAVQEKLKHKFGDTLLNTIAHFHQLIIVKPEPTLYLTSEARKIQQNYTEARKNYGYIEPNHKYFAACGSFMKMYEIGIDTYSERAGYNPVELGFILTKVRNRIPVDLIKVLL